jgi:PHD/YefM family antitoxin component YafN of YafNO toxin-antitoxin module
LAQVSETHDPETFAKAGHPDWDTTMNEEYRSLMENDTWDLIPLPKEENFSDVNGSIELSAHQMEVLKETRLS